MREIKFRAWFKVHKRMVYNLGFDENSFKSIEDNADIPCVYDKDRTYDNNNATFNFELMQFTGLHDKNGKEIYEWDIGKIAGCIFHVEFKDGAFWKVWSGKDPLFKDSMSLLEYVTDVEIIGNIHENPELIK